MNASSVESVGKLWFWQLSKCVIQSEFCNSERPEAVRFSHADFGFVVETFHDTGGKLFLSAEIVENELAVRARHAALTSHPPHAVEEKHQPAPERNELKAPFVEVVVAAAGLMTPWANCRRAGPGPHPHHNAFLVGRPFRPFVDESWKAIAVV